MVIWLDPDSSYYKARRNGSSDKWRTKRNGMVKSLLIEASPAVARTSSSRQYKPLESDSSMSQPSASAVTTKSTCPLNIMLSSMCPCEPRATQSTSGSVASRTVMVSNRTWPVSSTSTLMSPSSTRKMGNPVTPEKQSKRHSTPPKKTPTTLYHSPESIKLRVPGPSPDRSSPSPLLQTPQKLWNALKCSPTNSKLPVLTREHDWADRLFDRVTGCGASACSSTTQPPPCSPSSRARLTEDILQQHEHRTRNSPSRDLNFAGDKLAKTVIQKKTELQLAKERKELAQQELERRAVTSRQLQVIPSTPPRTEDTTKTKEWIELERQKALAAKWQRKKHEHFESMRAEQLRLAELERQRYLRAAELPASTVTPPNKKLVSPTSTPKTHQRKLIHI